MSGAGWEWTGLVQSRLTGDAKSKHLLALLAANADEEGRSFWGIDRMSAATEISSRSCRRWLTDLETRGLLKRERRRRQNGQLGVYDYWLQWNAILALPSSGYTPEGVRLEPRGEEITSGHLMASGNPQPPAIARPVDQRPPNGRAEPQLSITPVVDVAAVFEAWRSSTNKPRAKCDAKRQRLIEKALKEYPVEDVLDAVRGWCNSSYHRGENQSGTVYNDLGLLLRDAEHIERFRDLARRAEPRSNGHAKVSIGNHGEEVYDW